MSRWRILIVDDEEDIRTIIKGTLGARYEIVEAHDGVDALATLEIAEPDFIILDVMMPLMDGFQTCDAIRRHPRYSTVNVLFLSALNSKEDIKKGYGAGANLYLTKPFDPPRLLKNVDFYFQDTPPPMRRKKFTIEEVHALQKADSLKVAQAHASMGWQDPSSPAPPPSPAPAPVPQSAPPPPAPAPGSAAPAPTLPSNPVDGKIRILAADDETDIRIFIRAVLEPQYEVVLAADGMEAVDKITTYQPDVIILDAMMPRMSGYNLVQNLRRNARFARTPVLFVSGKATARDREYALKIGASEFLAKPFAPEELHSALKNLTQNPGFQVLPKAMTLAQINNAEEERLAAQAKEDKFRKDRIQRKEETELEKFLRENT
jgi:DNA-binding response OmpR family regulator